jgi:hypothetical protein
MCGNPLYARQSTPLDPRRKLFTPKGVGGAESITIITITITFTITSAAALSA